MTERKPCPRCSAENFTTSAICWQCGAPMKGSASTAAPLDPNLRNANYQTNSSPYAGPVAPPIIARNAVQRMQRPAVVTAAAILGLAFYGLRLLFGILVIVGGVASSAGSANSGAVVGFALGAGSVIMAISGLGIAAGVRLLQGYHWARSWLIGLSAYLLITAIFRFISGRSASILEDGLICVFAISLIAMLSLQSANDYCVN